MPIQATPDSVRPIQTPLPRIRNSAAISSAVMAVDHSFVVQRFVGGGVPGARAAQFEHQLVDEGDRQDHAAHGHASCGIHSGVASLPVEMS
jgi:hypothetical protein